MPNKEMDEFLATPEPAPTAEPPVAEAVIETPVEAVPAEGAPPVEPPKPPEVAAADDEPEDVKGLRSALVAERNKRNDYKGERDRLQGEVAALKAQIDAAAKAPPSVVQQPPPVQQEPPKPPPNPAEDPQGFMAWQEHRLYNERLNMSEAMLRQQHGDEDVEAKIAVFKEAAATNPAMLAELRNQAHPYRWAYDQAQRMLAMKEIGPDLKAYETKLREQIEAEVRAKIEAEFANAPMAAAPQPPRLPQSLGTARSAAPRTEPAATAPAFEDIFQRRRKSA